MQFFQYFLEEAPINQNQLPNEDLRRPRQEVLIFTVAETQCVVFISILVGHLIRSSFNSLANSYFVHMRKLNLNKVRINKKQNSFLCLYSIKFNDIFMLTWH